MRSKRNITQKQFADTTSRTYLSKLEAGKSSVTLGNLDQLSRRLELSPLTLLTLSENMDEPAADLITRINAEIQDLEREGGLPGLKAYTPPGLVAE